MCNNYSIYKKLILFFGFILISFHFCYSENSKIPIKLPEIGSFVLYKDYKPADWLKEKYNGKRLLTPINFVVVDTKSETIEQSELFINDFCINIGYPPRIGHFSEYIACINNIYYHQIPKK